MGNGGTTFVIAVPDQRGVSDWGRAMRLLRETTDSCLRQDGPRPTVLVAATRGADLPVLPGVDVVDVDREYRPLPSAWDTPRQAAIRADKGARVAAALAAARPEGHVMVVDWDDLVSRRISAHVAEHADEAGWYVDSGVVFDGGPLVLVMPAGMNALCGTTLIIRSDLLDVPPGTEGSEWTGMMYGSHVYARDILADRGAPLAPLPFPGAAYRVGTGVNGSYRSGLIPTVSAYVPRRRALRYLRTRRALRRVTG